MRAKPRLSIPTRVFLAFAFVLTAFGGLVGASLVQHQRTAETLRLVHEGYLPLYKSIVDARGTQVIFLTLLDRPLDESDSSVTRALLSAARFVRLPTIRKAVEAADRAQQLGTAPADRAALAKIRRGLDSAVRGFAAGDERFDQLIVAHDAHDEVRAAALLASLRTHERGISDALREAAGRLQAVIADTSAGVEEQERRSAELLAILTFVALVVAILLTWWTQRLLAPLPRLSERVAAVARGDLARSVEPARADEIGRVAAEFERMVDALAARDASLREAADRLVRSERLAAVGRMAAHVTHEVRNPLSSIGLNVELLEDEVASAGPEAKQLLLAIHREIDRLTAVTEEYLKLARVPQPRLETEDLGEVVRTAARFVAPEMEAHGIELVVTVEPGLSPVRIDEPQIRSALLNLLRNAREAMPDGGRIELAVARSDDGVTLRVVDQGTGIPVEDREHIFDPFFTTKERGTGLGLPLTQQIVIAHGGRIRCDAAPERGSVFELWFPSVAAAPPARDAAAPEPAREAT